MDDQLEERVAALERAVTDGEGDAPALAEAAVTAERLEDCETTVEDLEDRVAELEAATQALRGYVGNVRSVNREVEERADLALSRVEALSGRTGGDGDTPRQDGSGRGRQQDRGRGQIQEREQNRGQGQNESQDQHQKGDRDRESEQRSPADRCDRCGQPRAAGERTDASEDRPGTASELGGFGSGSPDNRAEPAWNGANASEPAGDGVRAGDSPEGNGPIERLRQLL
jgi:hypothetical protein